MKLIFVKYIHAVCKKMTRKGPKIVTLKYGSNFIASDVNRLLKIKLHSSNAYLLNLFGENLFAYFVQQILVFYILKI